MMDKNEMVYVAIKHPLSFPQFTICKNPNAH